MPTPPTRGARTTRRGRRSPQQSRIDRAAVAHGRRQAKSIIATRKKAKGAKGGSGVNGLVVAEGDSWFDYPFYDVLERLEDKFDFRVESVAHKGDTVEEMAHDLTQRAKLARMFEKVESDGKVPRAILLSGGGNDIAGAEFGVLLNHAAAAAQLSEINESVVAGVIDQRIRFAVVSVISAVTTLSLEHFQRKVPVIIHGYGYPVPDGRGYFGGFWILPGPWLEPGFRQKGYVSAAQQEVDLPRCTAIMKRLINRFNDMLKTIPGPPDLDHVSYLDLRGVLSNALPGYKQSWENELHPTKPGFEAVALAFRNRIVGFPQP
jgi:hypothetical protein